MLSDACNRPIASSGAAGTGDGGVDGVDCIGASLPRLVISLLGGGRKEMTLPLEYRHLLKMGLRKATDAADACIITDGTDAGLPTYIGRVMSDRDDAVLEGHEGSAITAQSQHSHSTGPPLIGISSWAKLMYQRPLADGRTTYTFEGLSKTPVHASDTNPPYITQP